MRNSATHSRGRLVATALGRAWRVNAPAWEAPPAELDAIASQLIRSGAGALVWRRLKNSHLSTTTIADAFHQQYRLNTVLAALHRQRIERVVTLLRSVGVEPMLVKGWAAARLYPDEGLRPYVDIDLSIDPAQITAAKSVLKDAPEYQSDIDLHTGVATLGGGSFGEIFARAAVVKLGDVDVRVPCPEDHLRIVAIHMLREGAWRPLWLCDVAAAVESRPDNFDWRICLGQNRRWSNWIISAVRLARELLGADISNTPAADDVKPLPAWVIPAVLKEWETPSPSMSRRHQAPMATNLRSPARLLSGFRHRWPNPIEGTVVSGGLFNGMPRFPFQLGAYLRRGAEFALPRLKLRHE